jgi:hypothetical protein
MNDIGNILFDRFVSDIDNIASDFINCFGLKHTSEVSNLSEPLIRWLDFRLRYIDPKPRRVLLSNKFPMQMSDTTKKAFIHIIDQIQHGEDVNPYQGKGLILHHDTSGEKRQNRTDLLWADWGIIHFHLTDKGIPSNQFFSDRSEWLMFAITGTDFVAIIDIRHHKEENLFSNPELIKIIYETWPELMERFELKGIMAPKQTLLSEEHAKLRKGGVSSCVKIGDKVFMGPGMGVTTASTPLRVTFVMDNIRKYAMQFARVVCEPNNEFQSEILNDAKKDINFQLCITPKGMAIYESHQDKAWLLPRRFPDSEFNYLVELNELLAPEWAVKQLIARGQ